MSQSIEQPATGEGDTATLEMPKPQAAKPKPKKLPPYRVLLHNDQVNEFYYVIVTVMELTPLKQQAALVKVFEAHNRGLSLLLTTHKERAELYQEQFKSKGLTVTIEPTEN